MEIARRTVLRRGTGLALVTIAGCVQAPDASQSPTNPPDSGTASSTSPTGTDRAGGTEAVVVEMTDELAFVPEALTVTTGSTVVWRNVGSVSHTVTAYEADIPAGAGYFASGGFETEAAARDGFPAGEIVEGDSYSHTFDTAGEYRYFCIPHEQAGMTGTVTVE